MSIVKGCRVCNGVDPKSCALCKGKRYFDSDLEEKYARLKSAVYTLAAALDTTEIGVIDSAYKNLINTVQRGEVE